MWDSRAWMESVSEPHRPWVTGRGCGRRADSTAELVSASRTSKRALDSEWDLTKDKWRREAGSTCSFAFRAVG